MKAKKKESRTQKNKDPKTKEPLAIYSGALDRISSSLKKNTIALEDIEEAVDALFSHMHTLEEKIALFEAQKGGERLAGSKKSPRSSKARAGGETNR